MYLPISPACRAYPRYPLSLLCYVANQGIFWYLLVVVLRTYLLSVPQQKLLSQVSPFVIYIYFRYQIIPHPQAGNGSIISHARDVVRRYLTCATIY